MHHLHLRRGLAAFEADELPEMDLWEGELLSHAPNDQSRDNRERERDLDFDRGADPGLRGITFKATKAPMSAFSFALKVNVCIQKITPYPVSGGVLCPANGTYSDIYCIAF